MTARNAIAIAVFLFGTTFLWLTPAMSGKEDQTLTGARWLAVQILVWLSILGFSAAAWAIFRSLDWWPLAVAVSAAVGISAAVIYLFAVRGLDGVANVASNVAIHAGVSLLLLAVVVVPALRNSLSQRLT